MTMTTTEDLIRAATSPAYVPLQVTRGDSFVKTMQLRRKATGSWMPLNGWQGKAQVRVVKGGQQVGSDLTVVVSQETTGTTVGLVTVSADGDNTGQWPHTAVWDLQLTDGTSALRKTIAAGPVETPPDVTQEA